VKKRASWASAATPCGRRAHAPKSRASAPFLDGKIDKIVALQPDLVIGFSDMQAVLADKLIRAGLNVFISNQRSVAEIFATLRLVAGLVGAQAARAEAWIEHCQARHAVASPATAAPRGRAGRVSTSKSGTRR
jgi:iron complex transport system substrate-binding protein